MISAFFGTFFVVLGVLALITSVGVMVFMFRETFGKEKK